MSEKEGQCVTCPCCGTTQFKSIITESRVKCRKCGTPFYTYVKDGVVITINLEAAKGAAEKRIRGYADQLIDFVTEDV